MKILFLTQYFPPEIGAAQTRTYELSTQLVRLGHDVSVLTTFPSYPTGIVAPEWRGQLFLRGEIDGVRVFRVWSHAAPNRGLLRRLMSQVSFGFTSAFAAPFVSAADVLIVESHPLFNLVAALAIRLMKRAPMILNVSDLWPESAIYAGVLKPGRAITFSKKLERLFYRTSDVILAMTGRIRDKVIAEGIQPERVVLFRTSVDTHRFCPGIDASDMRRSLGISGESFVVMYAGTFGTLNHVPAVIETAAIFEREGRNDIRFVLVGEGAQKPLLVEAAKNAKLTNVKFADPIAKERIPELLNAADCAIVSLRAGDFFRGTLPRKMFEAMACGIPLVVAAAGEAEDVVREAGAGICVAPEDVCGMHDAITALATDRDKTASMGRRGREYVRAHFDRDRRIEELLRCIEGVARVQRERRSASADGAEQCREITGALGSAARGRGPRIKGIGRGQTIGQSK